MASQASWQTGGAGVVGGADRGEGLPDQPSVENLLRRLLRQVEETERRYGEALDELQARLDRLTQKTDAARAFGTAGDAATLGGLHDQVSGLARRFEAEASTSLDDFERLGRAVLGGLDREGGFASGPAATPLPSPFAAETAKAPSDPFTVLSPFPPEPAKAAGSPFAFPVLEPNPTFPPFPPLPDEDRDLGTRLVEMAHRLEHSVEAAMAPKALDDLNARIDAIGRQLANVLAATPKPVSLEPLERQVAEIARQLGHAEGELAKIGEIEGALHRLIERLDGHASELSEVAAKAATEAARLVSGEAKLDAATAQRLDNMHRDLVAMSARSSAADDRFAAVIESVHESLTELVQQVERGVSRPRALSPERLRAEHGERAASEDAKNQKSKSGGDENSDGVKDSLTQSEVRTSLFAAERTAVRPPVAEPAVAKPQVTKPQVAKPPVARPPFGRATREPQGRAIDRDGDKPVDLDAPRTSRISVKKIGRTESEMEDDLVAAARRAAQAAALRAAERTGGVRRWAPSGGKASLGETHRNEALRVDTLRAEAPLRRGRPLLIVCAAVLLALSAILLYSRLQTKSWPELLPPAAEEGASPPASPSQGVPAQGAGQNAPAAAAPSHPVPPASSPSGLAPDAAASPAGDSESGVGGNFTDIAKTSSWPATVVREPVPAGAAPSAEETPQAEPAALTSAETPAPPPGIIFMVEEPSHSF